MPHRYQARPIEVTAKQIVDVPSCNSSGFWHLRLEDGSEAEMHDYHITRITPTVGDYWVVEDDGYAYPCYASVFRAKFRPVD